MSDDLLSRAARTFGAATFCNAKQAAYYLGCSRRHLQRLRSRGDGPPYHRHSRNLSYQVEDLIAWSQSRRGQRPHG